MGKFTPGPWAVCVNSDDRTAVTFSVVTEDNGDLLAEVSDDYGCGGEANANLIAAAPELYEALQAAVDLLDSCGFGGSVYGLNAPHPVVDMARSALAKANGA